MAQTNPPFMTGVPELLVLRMLADREMYGYEIVKAVRLVTAEAIGLGEGVIYPVLHGLEEVRRPEAEAQERERARARLLLRHLEGPPSARALERRVETGQFGVNAGARRPGPCLTGHGSRP